MSSSSSSSSSSKAVTAPYRAYHTSHLPDPWIVESKPMRKTRTSCSKFIERQVVHAWKRITGVTRRHQRTSILPKDFVLVTSRRRSIRCR